MEESKKKSTLEIIILSDEYVSVRKERGYSRAKPNQIDGIEYFSIKLFISNRYFFLTSSLFGIINGLMRKKRYFITSTTTAKKPESNRTSESMEGRE